MFFIISKLFWIVAAPTNLLILLVVAGLLLRATRWGRRIAGLALALLVIAAFTPVGAVLLNRLENRFPPPPAAIIAPTGIIVLGGAVDEDLSQLRDQVAFTEAAGRMTEAVHLARLFPMARLVFSGGSGHIRSVAYTEADAARRLWSELGVAPERMGFEDRSRNTYENAVFTKELVQPKPGEVWLLVTSAHHMPRSMGIFRQIGFPVIPYPVDYRTPPRWDAIGFETSASGNLRLVDIAVREWIGLLAYRLTGRTDALFPAP